jgi:hypothetical protein
MLPEADYARITTAEKSKKSALRASLSLDNRGPQKSWAFWMMCVSIPTSLPGLSM